MTDIVPSVTSLGVSPFSGKTDPGLAANSYQINAADYRLVIEEGPGGYVYKTLDRVTGEVIRQFPREELVRMRDRSDYAAGRLIAASV